MIQIDPYNPTTDDLFLYEDHVVSWTMPTSGSITLKRPYAWNPNSPLYGYRRSLEGICATYRTFSTFYGGNPSTAPVGTDPYECNQVNPYTDPTNKPIWWNSFPPTHRMISKRHLALCGHCFGVDNIDRTSVAGLNFSNLYAAGSYLDSVTVLRFIDGWDNPIELPKTQYEYPYAYDSANGWPSTGPNVKGTVSGIYNNDMAISLGASDFQYNPLTCINAGSVPSNAEWIYINAGNLTIQRMTNRATGGHYSAQRKNQVTYHGMQTLYASQYDAAFLHDSGSLFLYPIKEPSSVQAGDGIMGVAIGHVFAAFPTWSKTLVWNEGDPPRMNPDNPADALRPFYQPAVVARNDSTWVDFHDYWSTTRGHPYPELVNLPQPYGTLRASAAQINALQPAVAAMLGSVTP